MTHNDILRRFRYALDISDVTMIEIFRLSGQEVTPAKLAGLLKKEDDEGYIDCSDTVIGQFLDGLIVHRRGKSEREPVEVKTANERVTNNLILKKLRIALELKEEEMLAILKLADVEVSKSELSALFRKRGQKNYKECGDQFLRNFLKGLTVHHRK